MPREAQFFDACSGSAVQGFLKLRGNIPPRWIDNARASRKKIEPSIEKSLRKLKSLRKNHPGVVFLSKTNVAVTTNKTAAVPSLKRLSASIRNRKRLRTPASLNNAITETGSVAAISTLNGRAPTTPNSQCNAVPVQSHRQTEAPLPWPAPESPRSLFATLASANGVQPRI